MSCGKTLHPQVRGAFVALCVLGWTGATLAQDAGQPAVLVEGQTVTAAHGAAQRVEYAVEIPDGATYLLRVEQRNLDLIVTVTAPGGGASAVYDSPLRRDGSESIVLGPDVPGRHLISLRSDEHTGARGGHAIVLSRLTPATDARELAAWRLMSAAGAAHASGGEQGWADAVDAYQGAADLWDATGHEAERADALFGIANVEYWQRFNWERSAEIAAAAADLYGRAGLAGRGANALHLQGAALVESALETRQSATAAAVAPETEQLFAAALALLERARAVHEQLGNVYELGLVINNFGYTYYNKGELTRARGYFEQAAALLRGIQEWRAASSPLTNLAALDAEAGHLVAAAAGFASVLDLLPEGKVESYRANTLDNYGVARLMLGDHEPALQIFATVLELQRGLGDTQGEGRALRRIGEAYYALGELELATQFLQQSLPIAIASNDGRSQEGVLRMLGNVAYVQTDYSGALQMHRRALEVAASITDRAQLQRLVAKDLIALGRYDEARALAEQAAAGATAHGSQLQLARALHELGRAELASGAAAAALPHLTRAEELVAALGLEAESAEIHHSLALAARAGGRLEDAVRHGERALGAIESLRVRVAHPDLRAAFSAARRDYYETQIGTLMALHARSGQATSPYLRAAFETSERSRARMTADLLQEASISLRTGFDPALQERQAQLYAQLAEQRQRRDVLLERAASHADEAELIQVRTVLAALENELTLLEIEWRRRSPQFASLNAARPLTLDEAQALLDGDAVLLQYALGTDVSHVWVVTREAVTAVELAGRAVIESAARTALDALRSHAPRGAGAALDALAALVLGPVAHHLHDRTIVLALDGALQYVPFAVLPLGDGAGATAPLVASHEVVAVPSMSALAAAPRASASATKTLALFADPVLETSDPRFAAGRAPHVAAAVLPPRGGARNLGRLLSTGYEAEAIAALVPAEQRLVARGFAANRAAVLGADLRDYRYVHFATHGVVDARYPGLSALALSQFDDAGAPQDGFLRLHDIFDLKLAADVVVLSACETALGRDVRGEGLIGLTQGFMYAGARSLVASLWQVPDRATAELMSRFYGYLLNDGLAPSEALRRAQTSLAAELRFRDPFFWGGFVLLGDWR